jgi:hypothetical protein
VQDTTAGEKHQRKKQWAGCNIVQSDIVEEIEMNIMKSPGLLATVLAGSLCGMLSAQGNAQETPIEFRMVAAKNNMSSCKSYDASLSRVHTLTVMGDKAIIKSAGGIDDTMKQTSPKVYKTTANLGGLKFEVVADASKKPGTLEVTKPSDGCRWSAVAQ